MDRLRFVGLMPGLESQEKKGSAFAKLFTELDRRGMLVDTVDVSVSRWTRKALKLKNMSGYRIRWNAKDQLDPFRYELLSAKADKTLRSLVPDFNALVQIGSNFDVGGFCQERGIPAFSFHDNNVFRYIRSLPSGAVSQRRIERAVAFERQVYSRLSGVFTMSRTLARSFCEDFGLPEEKVHYAGFGSPFPAEDITNKSYEKKQILFVATHSFERKGGETLLEAFRKVRKKHSDATLVLVGRDWKLDEPGVHSYGFFDKRSPTDLERYKSVFRESSLFVMPSFNEAFGEVFVEAMSCGLPCIGADNGVMPELIVGNEAGAVIRPGDSNHLASLMTEWLDSPQTLQAMGHAGHWAVQNEYNWGKVVSRMQNVVNQFV